MMKQIVRVAVVNFAVFSSLVIGVEVAAQVAFFAVRGHFPFQESRQVRLSKLLFEPHPYLVGRLRASTTIENGGEKVTTTARHTRWTGAPENDGALIRVAVLGGSTVFGTRVTDADTWPARLQATLGTAYSVVNYGLPGYSTPEAIVQMALIVPELKPDVVVFYEGWNDIRNYHDPMLGPDYYTHGMRQFKNLAISAGEPTTFEKLSAVSATARFARAVQLRRAPVQRAAAAPSSDPDPFVDRIYARNLRTLRLLTAQIGAQALFVPQILNARAYQQDVHAATDWSPGIRNASMSQLMDRFNQLMLGVCEGEPKCATVRSVLDVPWHPDDFVDYGHFSRQGGEKFATEIARAVLAAAPAKPLLH